jgi:hypothetical protein
MRDIIVHYLQEIKMPNIWGEMHKNIKTMGETRPDQCSYVVDDYLLYGWYGPRLSHPPLLWRGPGPEVVVRLLLKGPPLAVTI